MQVKNQKRCTIQFGKPFALSSNESLTLCNKDDLIKIEITNWIHEWGYDAPDEDANKNYFEDVSYYLKVKVRNTEKNFEFYSSQVKDDISFDLDGYSIHILSDKFENKSCLVEMIVNKKETK